MNNSHKLCVDLIGSAHKLYALINEIDVDVSIGADVPEGLLESLRETLQSIICSVDVAVDIAKKILCERSPDSNR